MDDGGFVDWLLSQIMLSVSHRKSTSLKLFAAFFRFAHLLQLLAMTYVAAQKGVDGVSQVVLLLRNYAAKILGGNHQMARDWLSSEGRDMDGCSDIPVAKKGFMDPRIGKKKRKRDVPLAGFRTKSE